MEDPESSDTQDHSQSSDTDVLIGVNIEDAPNETGAAASSATASDKSAEDLKRNRSDSELWLERHWEPIFFKLRYLVLIPVILGVSGAAVMFLLGGTKIYKSGSAFFLGSESDKIILPLIKGLDAFLMGIILIIFSFGIYDFFVSPLQPAEDAGIRDDWLKFDHIGDLKNKIIEVVFVVLAIVFFEEVVAGADSFNNPFKLLIIPFGAAIMIVSMGFFKWATD